MTNRSFFNAPILISRKLPSSFSGGLAIQTTLLLVVLSLIARFSAALLRARFSLPRALLAWFLCGAGVWLMASAAGPAPFWLAVVPALCGFLLSFRFPETHMAVVVDALTLGLWAIVTESTLVAAASLVYPAFGRFSDMKISDRIRHGRTG